MLYQIEVRKTKKMGRGVYALKNFKRLEIIEKCPVVHLKPGERRHCEKTILNTYIYPWRSLQDAVIVLGYGSIYNHSVSPNTKWVRSFKTDQMFYKAIRPIKKGEEISVDYNGPYEPDSDMDWLKEPSRYSKK
ncbi:hypothetical protein A3F03_04640 [Candidatus Roizmanbacteria bacterium RIFCSPHIGHO2_12_FULL_41_11]|uniref:SET domain-containing protein n=3 Tax=Candidatus Roizmaniibacteriota TaxID=1752723 RepID=A0A1F7J5Y6_9BACT|nr:MAG: hypothetical protein A3F03_04640 [Candidatus Roizmanbacteria bacterium RIFCSPHIGHO2_12_FULL_41_11]OGK51030.1 MAG: hypothetical protein A2966_02885 [Candidatus Roizmanbacteria bacterium RIFCSPLOWO2_01_FULL_41_22]